MWHHKWGNIWLFYYRYRVGFYIMEGEVGVIFSAGEHGGAIDIKNDFDVIHDGAVFTRDFETIEFAPISWMG